MILFRHFLTRGIGTLRWSAYTAHIPEVERIYSSHPWGGAHIQLTSSATSKRMDDIQTVNNEQDVVYKAVYKVPGGIPETTPALVTQNNVDQH